MGNINWGRVILGGLLAGVIIDASEFIINGVVLKQDWADAMTKLGKPADISGTALATFNVVGLILGVATIWLYAAIRARYGAGARTAVTTALAIWVVGYALPAAWQIGIGLAPTQTMTIAICLGLVEIIIASLAGAYVYKEDSATTPVAMSVGAR